MELVFFSAAGVAVIATLLAITNCNPVHALMYLIVSLLAVATVFFTLGAPFAGILEVIIYAGAIMVLFVFVVMLLNLGKATIDQERHWLTPRVWIGPGALTLVLLYQLVRVLIHAGGPATIDAASGTVGATEVGLALYGPYVLAVELASMLLLAGLVVALHLGRHE